MLGIKKISKLFLFLTFLFSITVAVSGLDVAEEELREHADQSIEFESYLGPHEVINSREDIINIGRFLGRTTEDGFFVRSYNDKYTVIHAVNPSMNKRFDADIFILHETALVDHIRNLRWIIFGYLNEYYDYSTEDAELISEFVTYYNAVFRKDMGYIVEKYKQVVTENVEPEKVGLSKSYKEWAGGSMMLIPLTEKAETRVFGSLNSDELSEDKVIEDLREQEDKGIEPRKNIVELKEREIDAERSEIEEEKQEIAQEEQELEVRKEQLEERKQEVDEREEELALLEETSTPETPPEETEEIQVPGAPEENEEPRKTESGPELSTKSSQSAAEETAQEPSAPQTSEPDLQEPVEEEQTNQQTPQQQETEAEEEDIQVVRAEIQREREELAREEEEIQQQETALEQRKEEVAEREEKQEEREEQIKEEREEIARDQQELITEEKTGTEGTTAAAETVPERETFPFIIFSSRGNSLYGNYVYADKNSGEVVTSSSFTTIMTKQVVTAGDFFLAIAENGQEYNLIQLDKESLSPVLAGEEKVYKDGYLIVEEGDIFTPVQKGRDWVLGRFNQDLVLTHSSEETIVPYSMLLYSEGTLFAQDSSGKIVAFNAEDLTRK